MAELRRLRETFARKHTMLFNENVAYIVRMADQNWRSFSKRQFHALVNQHLVAEGYEPKD